MVTWFNVKEKKGVATLYSNNITLNVVAMYPFEEAYRVQVGQDDEGRIIIKPLIKSVVESGDLDESCLLKIERHKSFARISSALLMRQIEEALGLTLSKEAVQFETSWDSKENVLTLVGRK